MNKKLVFLKFNASNSNIYLLSIIFICFFFALTASIFFQKKDPPKNNFEVLNLFYHQKENFTQGLFFCSGRLFESTGLYGSSKLIRYNKDFQIEKIYYFKKEIFAEGSTCLNNEIFVLSWKEKTIFKFDLELNLLLEKNWPFNEGWGLSNNGSELIATDGSEKIYFIDPERFLLKKTIFVKENGKKISFLNEIEYANKKIYTNIWKTDDIVVINPENGNVEKRYNLTNLRKKIDENHAEVLNGIAYNDLSESFLITGKFWDKFFEIKF